jgi:hypothetical protein
LPVSRVASARNTQRLPGSRLAADSTPEEYENKENDMKRLPIAAALIVAASISAALPFASTSAHAADVHVGVNIGVPAPPHVVFEAPPRLVVVPGVPTVHYAPDVSVNFFTYGGRYYTYDSGNWFVADYDRGPYTYVERRYVPAPVLHVPTRYYRVPPRLVGGGHWHGDHHYESRRYHSHKGNWHDNSHGHGKHWNKGHGKGHKNGHKHH